MHLGPEGLQASSQDKLELYQQRLYLLQQRVRRNQLFQRPVYGNLSGQQQNYCEVTSSSVMTLNKECQDQSLCTSLGSSDTACRPLLCAGLSHGFPEKSSKDCAEACTLAASKAHPAQPHGHVQCCFVLKGISVC